MKSELELIRNKLTKRFEDACHIYDQELECKSNQKSLIDFEKKSNELTLNNNTSIQARYSK